VGTVKVISTESKTAFLRRRKVKEDQNAKQLGVFVQNEPEMNLEKFEDFPVMDLDMLTTMQDLQLCQTQRLQSPEEDENLRTEFWINEGLEQDQFMLCLPVTSRFTVPSMELSDE
jgi:hypothetical protein